MNARIEKFKNNERVQKVRLHFKENRKTYLVGAGSMVVGAVGMLVASRSGNISISNPAMLNWKPVANTVQVSMTRPGPKSFVVQEVVSQKTWPSLRATAKDLGLNPGELSKHLKGEVPDIGGLCFEKIAEI